MTRFRISVLLLVVVVVGPSCSGHDGREMVANGIGFTPEPTVPVGEAMPTHSVSADRARVQGQNTVGAVVLETTSGTVGTLGSLGSYEVSTPQLGGVWEDDPLNVALRKPMLAEIARFADDLVVDEEAPAVAGLLTGWPVVHLLDDRLLSVVYDFEVIPGGAARPSAVVRSVLLDLETSEPVAIGDLFLAGSPWPETVAFLSRQDLQARLGAGAGAVWDEGAGDRYGLGPESGNFRLFGVTTEHLVLRFEQYQVGPGALGAPEATIPWSSLVGLVDPGGPVGHLLP